MQSWQRRRKHWGWLLHTDGVPWFPRKSLSWQWSASPWGASLHNLPHRCCHYTTVALVIHSVVMGHCWDSCVSLQNKTSTGETRFKWEQCRVIATIKIVGALLNYKPPEACESTGRGKSPPTPPRPIKACTTHHPRALCLCVSVCLSWALSVVCACMLMGICFLLMRTCTQSTFFHCLRLQNMHLYMSCASLSNATPPAPVSTCEMMLTRWCGLLRKATSTPTSNLWLPLSSPVSLCLVCCCHVKHKVV